MSGRRSSSHWPAGSIKRQMPPGNVNRVNLRYRIGSVFACTAIVAAVPFDRMIFLIHLASLVLPYSILKQAFQRMRILLTEAIGKHDQMLIALFVAIFGKPARA